MAQLQPADHLRHLTGFRVSVSAALDLLKVQGAARRDTRVRWQQRGLVDGEMKVDLRRVAPDLLPRAWEPAAPARAKRRPAGPTAAQRAAQQAAARRREEETWASDLDRDFYYRRRGIFHG